MRLNLGSTESWLFLIRCIIWRMGKKDIGLGIISVILSWLLTDSIVDKLITAIFNAFQELPNEMEYLPVIHEVTYMVFL